MQRRSHECRRMQWTTYVTSLSSRMILHRRSMNALIFSFISFRQGRSHFTFRFCGGPRAGRASGETRVSGSHKRGPTNIRWFRSQHETTWADWQNLLSLRLMRPTLDEWQDILNLFKNTSNDIMSVNKAPHFRVCRRRKSFTFISFTCALVHWQCYAGSLI